MNSNIGLVLQHKKARKTIWTYPLYVALNQQDLSKTQNLDKAHMSSPQHIAF